MSFEADFQKGIDLAMKRANIAKRKIALEVFTGVVMMTPVDTGRARANWQPAIGVAVGGQVDAVDPTGSGTLESIRVTVDAWDTDDPAILCNNLPYIEALENGHSGQAPAGMVGVTVARFAAIAREVGIRVKAGQE